MFDPSACTFSRRGFLHRAGHADSQWRYAWLLDEGYGQARDPVAAERWRREAANGGNVDAMRKLAIQAGGRGDWKAAEQWLLGDSTARIEPGQRLDARMVAAHARDRAPRLARARGWLASASTLLYGLLQLAHGPLTDRFGKSPSAPAR